MGSSFLHLEYFIAIFLVFSYPPPLRNPKAPPLSSRDIWMANDLRRPGERQPHQTLPAVEYLWQQEKGSLWWIFLFPIHSFRMFVNLIFYLISNRLNILNYRKLDSTVSEGGYEHICVFPSHGISFACLGWCPKTLFVKKILRKKNNGGGFYSIVSARLCMVLGVTA